MPEIEILEYLDPAGRSPFALWFGGLNAGAAARATVALTRLGNGDFSNVQGVGAGVYEYKIDFGPDIGSIAARTVSALRLCLAAAPRSGRGPAIAAAHAAWAAYKRAKAGKGGEKWH